MTQQTAGGWNWMSEKQHKALIQRRAKYQKLYDNGMTMADIADLYGITKQRVHQILKPKARKSRT